MAAFQLNWVVALRPEAQAVIERFRLQPSPEKTLYPIYANQDGSVRLTISGPGKIPAAAATAALAATGQEAGMSRGWLNFGIAGCGEQSFGQVFLGAKIVDFEAQNAWYPAATWSRKSDLPRRGIATVSRPTSDYPTNGDLVEMEAAGFYPIALRDSTAELCHVLKVVSDDPDHSMKDIDKDLAAKLCRDALQQSCDWLDSFMSLGAEDSERLADPIGFSDLLSKVHFTSTQQHQLRRLLQQWQANRPDDPFSLPPEWASANARQILQNLRAEVFVDC